MTMPSERTRALRWAGEFLRELQVSGKLDPELKRQVQGILRHDPSADEIRCEASLHARPDWIAPWLAPEQT